MEMRKLTLSQLEKIGEGGAGWIYKINDEQIVKVYKDIDLETLVEQKKWAREMFKLGIPTAISFETVMVDGKYGIVYEMFNSKTVGQMVNENPQSINEAAEAMGSLLKTIHSCSISSSYPRKMKYLFLQWACACRDGGIIKQRDVDSIKEILNLIPESNCILHGDFHEGNVMTMNGEYLLIDIDDACIGHPLFEITLHYMNHEILSKRPELLMKSQGTTPETAKRMAELTRENYFKDMDPEKVQMYRKLCKLMVPMMMVVTPGKIINNTEFFDEKNKKMTRNLLLPIFRISKLFLKKNLKKFKNMD